MLDVSILDHGRGLMDDGLVEPGTSASCLIHQVGGDALAHKVGVPAFPPVRCRLQAGRRMTGPVHHDHRGHVALLALRYLELNVHLTDRDLIGNRRLIGSARSGHSGVVGDLWHATDEEAALVFDHQRFGQEFFNLRTFLRSCAPRHRK